LLEHFFRYPPVISLKTLLATGLVGILLVLAPVESHALASCTVSTTGADFGSYNVFSSLPNDTTANVRVSCTLLGVISLFVLYSISLSAGGAGQYLPRSMTMGSHQLNYNLYSDSARTTIWGDGSSGTVTVSDGYLLGLGTTVNDYTVYGRVPALQNVYSGYYSDSLVVTVDY
jgi:spore coat protein U-like protein